MLRLSELIINDEAADLFTKKLKLYNELHSDDQLSYNEFAKELLEIAIKFIDITGLD